MHHYKNGWELFDKMMELYPTAEAKGEGRFSPRSAQPLVPMHDIIESITTTPVPASRNDSPPRLRI